MMQYLLDTDICIYWLKGRQSVISQVSSIGIHELSICSVTVAELYFGAYNSSKVTQNLIIADDFVESITVINLTINSLKKFGQLKAKLRQAGTPIEDSDLLIASVALTEDLILVTNNTRHYERIDHLKLENWA